MIPDISVGAVLESHLFATVLVEGLWLRQVGRCGRVCVVLDGWCHWARWLQVISRVIHIT